MDKTALAAVESTSSLQKSMRSNSQMREARDFIIKGQNNNSNIGSTTSVGFAGFNA